MAIKKIPLNGRLKLAKDGRFVYPETSLPLLESSASWPLKKLLQKDALNNVETIRMNLNITKPLETYQDLVNLLGKYWPNTITKPPLITNDSYNETIQEYMSSIILDIYNCYVNELRRRAKDKNYVFVKNAADFPGFAIPLPQLYQAGSIRCKTPGLAKYLENAYKDKVMAFLEKYPKIKKDISVFLQDQPSFPSPYDGATISYAVNRGCRYDILSEKEAENYCYDLFILPYLMQ